MIFPDKRGSKLSLNTFTVLRCLSTVRILPYSTDDVNDINLLMFVHYIQTRARFSLFCVASINRGRREIPTDEAVKEVEQRLLGVETNITSWKRRQNMNNNFSAVVPYDMEQQMNDEKLKNLGGGDYWHELLERIRDIRSSEKVMYRQVLDLYATSAD